MSYLAQPTVTPCSLNYYSLCYCELGLCLTLLNQLLLHAQSTITLYVIVS
jgi:hypothetical protein